MAAAVLTPAHSRTVRAATRAGCRIGALGEPFGAVECGSGWAAARLLVALATEDASTPYVRAMAKRLGAGRVSALEYVYRVSLFVRRAVRFEKEVGELFIAPRELLAAGVGDCDDHARLVYALLVAGGVPARLAFLARGSSPAHVAAQAWIASAGGGAWEWVETTVDAEVGEHPIRAARRTGRIRRDITNAPEEVTMADVQISSVAQVQADQEALARLGYYVGPVDGNALSADMRSAVRRFQAAAGVAIDGLIGPVTRAAIRRALPPQECGWIYGMGDAADARLTSDVDDAFFPRLREVADRLGVEAEDLLAVLFSESRVQPAIHGRDGAGREVAFGVNQMTSVAFDAIGWMPGRPLAERGAAFARLPASEQLTVAVEPMYRLIVDSYGRGDPAILSGGASRLYVANAFPAFLPASADPDAPLARNPSVAYVGNYGFDAGAHPRRDESGQIVRRPDGLPEIEGGKGYITRRDMGAVVERAKHGDPERWRELKARLDASGSLGGAGVAGALALLVGIALAVAAVRS